MTVRTAIAFGALAVAFLLPSASFAAPTTTTVTSTSAVISTAPATTSKPGTTTARPPAKPTTTYKSAAKQTYDLDWTLPTAGKSGCNVCHGDQNLVRIRDGRTVSLYVNPAVLQNSAHKNVPCTSCHVDFAYKTPHDTIVKNGDEWRAVAKLACKNCHKDAFTLFSNGAHSPAGRPGGTSSTIGAPGSSAPGKPRPLCGDCHGGHAIPSKEDTEARAAVRASALTMCGTCHVESTVNYNDYYHGAAYRKGASTAPACWQCHETHQVFAAKDRRSAVNINNLSTTCGLCHAGTDEFYIAYAPLVHHSEQMYDENPLKALFISARESVQALVASVKSVFKR